MKDRCNEASYSTRGHRVSSACAIFKRCRSSTEPCCIDPSPTTEVHGVFPHSHRCAHFNPGRSPALPCGSTRSASGTSPSYSKRLHATQRVYKVLPEALGGW